MDLSKDIVQNYIDSALKSEVLEDNFLAFTEDESNVTKTNGFKRILMTIRQSSEPDDTIKHYVALMVQVKTPAKVDVLFDVLHLLVQQHPHLSKAVCEALLSCEKLDYYNRNLWMRSFNLISETLLKIDYKGVRSILKYELDIIYSLPEQFDILIIPQLETLYTSFSMILNRDACIMPAYLSLDDIQKKIAQCNAPVWKFAELFYHFIESFRPTAQVVSIINRPNLLPVVGFNACQANISWRLDPISAKFQLKGLLPYREKLKEPQVGQIRYLLEQSYSRDMICNSLSIEKHKPNHPEARCSELIEQIAVVLVNIMNHSESDLESYSRLCASTSEHIYQWVHLSNTVVYFIMNNQATLSFNQLIESLSEKLQSKNSKRGREYLMWTLMQYITGLPKATVQDFISVHKLFDILYTGRKPLPLPVNDCPFAPQILAAASIWHQLIKRAELDQVKLLKPLPASLQLHYEFIANMKSPEEAINKVTIREVIFLNAHGTNKLGYPPVHFVDSLCKIDLANKDNTMLIQPLPVKLLDSLTTHSKISLLHVMTQKMIAIAQSKQPAQAIHILTPALIETYGRLLVYTDSESFGIKTFISQLMSGPQAVWRFQAWDVYHVLLEMYSHRIHHLQMQFKYQMLISLHSLSPMIYGANQIQLSMTMEATEIKLLLGLCNYEALHMPIKSRHENDTKTSKHMINNDSEELNKVLVLVLARSTCLTSSDQVNANTLDDILNEINRVTPLYFPKSTLNFFPTTMRKFFNRTLPMRETDKAQLRLSVEEEYRKWQAMANEETLFAHFSQPNGAPLFICVLWKMLIDNDYLNPVVYRILDSFRIRTLSAHLRTLVDYMVHIFSTSGAGLINKNTDALNKLIWKFQIVSLDRLILCMCLKNFESTEAQVCFFIISQLLFKSELKTAVHEFCKMQSPEHWKQFNSYEINAKFQASYPEKYYHDYLNENNIRSNGQTLPSFFSNVCLRFIPVLDILTHRTLELRKDSPHFTMKIDNLLDTFGCLYKFHDKPLTYLYNTLYYYDPHLPPPIKKKLTHTIVGAFHDIRPQNWCLSETMIQYLRKPIVPPPTATTATIEQPQEEWQPGYEYYRKVIGRLVDTLQGKNSFYHTDWRFNEYPNVKAHAVYATAIELMTLPVAQDVVGNSILDLVLTSYVNQDRSTMAQWMNAIGLIMTSLPASYYDVLNTKILEYMKSPLLTNRAYTRDILHMLNFCDSHEWMYESQISYLVAITHAIWQHSSTGQIYNLPTFWRNDIKQAVETESQFLFVCCLIGPFLARIERSHIMKDIAVEFYEMLGKVDSTSDIQHLNTISDFFYHIKYQFLGDAAKNDIERCIKNFKPRLQYCLRFITHLNILNNEHHMKHE